MALVPPAQAATPTSWGALKQSSAAKLAQPAPTVRMYRDRFGKQLTLTTFDWGSVFARAPGVQSAAINIGIGGTALRQFTLERNMGHFAFLLDRFVGEVEELGFVDSAEQDLLFVWMFRVLEHRWDWRSPNIAVGEPVPVREYRRIIALWRLQRTQKAEAVSD